MSEEGSAGTDRGAPWRVSWLTVGAVVGVAVGLLAMAALAGTVDPDRLDRPLPFRAGGESSSPGSPGGGDVADPASPTTGADGTAGTGSGVPELAGAVELVGPGGEVVELTPIPGCDGGFEINDQVLIVPDPEACGFRPVEPGEEASTSDGRTILVPDAAGEIGGVRIDESGAVEVVPVAEIDGDTIRFIQGGDGAFLVEAGGGGSVRVEPVDGGGFRVLDQDGQVVAVSPGGGLVIDLDDLEAGGVAGAIDDAGGSAGSEPVEPETSDPGDEEPPGSSSALGDLAAILVPVLAAIGLAGALVYLAVRHARRSSDGGDAVPDAVDDGAQPHVVDYAAEIDAIDRLLWEIEQEPDPRRAIQRVYAAVETGLGNDAMARQRSETPGVYLQRVLGRLDGLREPLSDLTGLFELARFSTHDITTDMRHRALAILQTVRAHYAAATTDGGSTGDEPILLGGGPR